jgi:ParB-like chromosome segregation protein Spo0J
MAKNRIVGLRKVKASKLLANPRNWRLHTEAQRSAVAAALEKIGYVDALVARKLDSGELELLDGHLRAEIDPNDEVPVLLVELNDEEADFALATLDPLGAMAKADSAKLGQLLETVDTESAELDQMLADLLAEGLAETASTPTELRPIDAQPPPVMTWVLIGIPTVRFGEIAEQVERLATVPGVTLETSSNNG